MERTLRATNPRKLMDEHIDVLRSYAEKVVVHDGALTEFEELDKSERMAEYIAIGRSFDLSGAELIGQIFGDMLKPERSECGCPTCRGRARRSGHPDSGDDLAQSGV